VGLVLILFLGWREALIVMITVPLIMGITLTANLLAASPSTASRCSP